jgi:hypothetical protein
VRVVREPGREVVEVELPLWAEVLADVASATVYGLALFGFVVLVFVIWK